MSTAQRRGLNYEHEMANGIYERTHGKLFPLRVAWSGNGNIPAPDVFVDDGKKGHAFEFKRTTQDRISLTYNPDDDEPDDLSDLITFAQNYPRTCCAYIGVRFTHRQLLLAKIWLQAPDPLAMLESAVTMCPVDASVTYAGNLSIQKPDSDLSDAKWASAQVGDDVEYLLATIGYGDYRD